jgi:NitT/TauT family transport system permease protein/sulfonate transport system permease protein
MPNEGKATSGQWLGRQAMPRLIGDSLIVAVVALWWVASLGLPAFVLPNPLAVARAIADLFVQPDQLVHVGASFARVIVSVCLAVMLGTSLALLPYRWPVLRKVIDDGVRPVLNAFPSVGWAILAVIWFKVSNASVIFIEVAILTPFCLINVDEGLKELDQELAEMARSFSRSRRRTFFRVTLPLLAPYLFGAIRMSYGVGWKLALVAELFGATTGLGFLLLQAQTVGDAATVFATCITIVIMFIVGERLLIDPLARMMKPAQT